MTDEVDQIVDILNDLDADEIGVIIAALVASFLESVTDCEVEAYCELAVFNQDVAMLLSGEGEALH